MYAWTLQGPKMVNKSLVIVLAAVSLLVGLNYSGLVNKEVISEFMTTNQVILCKNGGEKKYPCVMLGIPPRTCFVTIESLPLPLHEGLGLLFIPSMGPHCLGLTSTNSIFARATQAWLQSAGIVGNLYIIGIDIIFIIFCFPGSFFIELFCG
jgi:hypothetical protein